MVGAVGIKILNTFNSGEEHENKRWKKWNVC